MIFAALADVLPDRVMAGSGFLAAFQARTSPRRFKFQCSLLCGWWAGRRLRQTGPRRVHLSVYSGGDVGGGLRGAYAAVDPLEGDPA
ncbi:MAG: hypothetical protein R2856_27530 [Caldilineaceae bacterium]